MQQNESFKRIDGRMKYSYTQIFAKQDGKLYSRKWTDRFSSPKALEDLQEIQFIQTENRGPERKPNWSAVYVKTPSLLSYADRNLEKQITREVDIYEILRKHPHPNIVTYYGCQLSNGRVSGLCFKRYTTTLLETVNPQRLNKAAFISSRRESVRENMISGLAGILAGIKHLHSLGLVHKDINPANVMLDEDGTLVLIDFDSCRYVGESLHETGTKRTYHWHDPSVDVSLEKNDFDAFKDLHVWLAGSPDEYFLFE